MFYRFVVLSLIGLLFSLTSYAAFDNIQLSVWANEAIIATYTYDYNNYISQQKQIAKYFTAQAWITYGTAMENVQLPETVQKNAYTVSAVALMPPTIKTVDKSHWQATMPVLVVYKNPQYQQKQTLEVALSFSIAPTGQGVRGLSITNFHSKVIQPPCRCEAENAKALAMN